jgi:hypothetical protein
MSLGHVEAPPEADQAKAYISMLVATASLGGSISPAAIFDFSLAAVAARDMAVKE